MRRTGGRVGPTFAALALFRRAVPSLLPHMRRTHLRTQALALLDMYDALSSVSDDLAATLAGPRFLPLLSRLAELADAAQDEFEAMFADFEAGLARPETWKAGVTDGSVRGLGAAMRCRRVSAVVGAALCATVCAACGHAPDFFAAQTARVRRKNWRHRYTPPTSPSPHPPFPAPHTTGPPRRCADAGPPGRPVCAPACAAAVAGSGAAVDQSTHQDRLVRARPCVASVPCCGVGGPRVDRAGIRAGRKSAHLQVQGAAHFLGGGLGRRARAAFCFFPTTSDPLRPSFRS